MLKLLNYHRSQDDRSVVIKSCSPCFFGDKDNGGGVEAGWYMACFQPIDIPYQAGESRHCGRGEGISEVGSCREDQALAVVELVV